MKWRTHIAKIALSIVEEKVTLKGIQNGWINQNHHSGILLLSKQEDYKHHLTIVVQIKIYNAKTRMTAEKQTKTEQE